MNITTQTPSKERSSWWWRVKNSRYFYFLLALSSALLFWLAWPVKPFAPLLFLVFVPVFLLEHALSQGQHSGKSGPGGQKSPANPRGPASHAAKAGKLHKPGKASKGSLSSELSKINTISKLSDINQSSNGHTGNGHSGNGHSSNAQPGKGQGKVPKAGLKFFLYTYLTLLLWNLSTTWWVINATIIGGIFALLANSMLMFLPLWAFRFTKKWAGPAWGYFGFVLYWMSFEYMHLNWDLSWPWLSLGNGFAMFPQWVQWYEWTGVFGGTLWILLGNLAFFLILKGTQALERGFIPWRSLSYGVLCIILLPIGISYIMYANYQENGTLQEMVILQPNIDPYAEKFEEGASFIPYEEQVQLFIDMSAQELREESDFLLWPETAIGGAMNEAQLHDQALIRQVRSFREAYQNLSILTGITSYSIYREGEVPATARYEEDFGYFDFYNAAMFISDTGTDTVYHKSKLVPGVEIMPYPQFFDFLSQTIFNLGGTVGGLGRQEERTVFFNAQGIGLAPSICYESVYGEFMAEFIRNGAHFIFIITNDGWWGDSPGHRQHFHYASLRAVETRRSIARCANTGISGFFNQRGQVLQQSEYWEPAVLRGEIRANDALTFYARHGDWLGRTAVWMAFFVFLAAFVKNRLPR